MTRQEIFNIVWDHLITKDAPKSEVTTAGAKRCAYRGYSGAKCAVGALVTDEECADWGTKGVLRVALPERLQGHEIFLCSMQRAHDAAWSHRSRRVLMEEAAREYNLEIPA